MLGVVWNNVFSYVGEWCNISSREQNSGQGLAHLRMLLKTALRFSIAQNMLACLSSQDSKEVELFKKLFNFHLCPILEEYHEVQLRQW